MLSRYFSTTRSVRRFAVAQVWQSALAIEAWIVDGGDE
jgi:hypothetical protein